MSDFDPDAYLEQQTSAQPAPFDPDAHLADAVPTTAEETVAPSSYDRIPLVPAAKAIVGLGENVLSGVTGGVGSLADAITGSDPGTHDLAYRPRTEAGQQIAQALGVGVKKIGNVYDAAFGAGPLATTLKERIPEALGAVGTVTGATGLAKGIIRPTSFTADDVPIASSHPLQGVADAESSRIANSLAMGRSKGINLPERTVSPNQEAANGIVREDLNLPAGSPVTPKVLDAARQQFGAPAYEAVSQVPKIKLGSAYEDAISDVDTDLIKDQYRPPPGGSMTGERAVELSKYLRDKASAYFQEGTVEANEKGQAHWDAAQAVEDAVERRLKATGQGQLSIDWDNARTYYAKTYSVQSALDGAGNVVVPKLKTQLIKGKPLSGGIQDLATMGAANPEAFRSVPMAPQVGLARKIAARVATPLATAGGGIVGGAVGFPTTGAVLGESAGARLSGFLNPSQR